MNELDKLKAALSLDISGDKLAQVSGMSQQAINKYRTGAAQVENMRFKNAINLINFWEEEKMKNKGILIIDVAVRYHDFIKAGIFEKGFEVLEDSYLELVISKEQYVKLLGKHIHLAYVHEDLDTAQDDDIRIYVKRGKGTRADVFEINRIA